MKKFTNHTAGPKGINIKDAGTVWIEPGQTVEIDPKTINGDVPDLGKPGDTPADADTADMVAAVEAENADLKKQVEALTKERDDLKAEVNELIAEIDTLKVAHPAKAEPASADDIKAAVALLDAENDDHWTAAGLPAVEAVAELAGKPVTRAAINDAAPEAKRPTA